jgi:SAM-dependent methyltransferase
MPDVIQDDQTFWDRHARHDPLWAILSDPTKKGRQWDLRSFFETGAREISLLMYLLRDLQVEFSHAAALDFGCGVGRLTQSLASYFDRVVGLDISPEMIRLAERLNWNPAKVQYVCNIRPDLQLFNRSEFTFVYSDVVLQHINPETALDYLTELFRIVARDGILVFQLPSHLRPRQEQVAVSASMPADAYRAAIVVHGSPSEPVEPGSQIRLLARVTNTGVRAWAQDEFGPIRFGNHWLSAGDQAMLVQDDGRASLPQRLAPGDSCWVSLSIKAPAQAGEYHVECDVVHEGLTWFADQGSATCRHLVVVGTGGQAGHAARDTIEVAGRFGAVLPERLDIPDDPSDEDLGPFPMHGIHRHTVEAFIHDHDGELLHLEPDEKCGKEWVGYRYFVRKRA